MEMWFIEVIPTRSSQTLTNSKVHCAKWHVYCALPSITKIRMSLQMLFAVQSSDACISHGCCLSSVECLCWIVQVCVAIFWVTFWFRYPIWYWHQSSVVLPKRAVVMYCMLVLRSRGEYIWSSSCSLSSYKPTNMLREHITEWEWPRMCPKWHHISFIVHYFWPEPYG